ncbi:hypothetical protein [Sporosarcina sp. NCCP-2222]|uniref:hypothetical protein n=1 Tax=Sporosarcina sp. NCCP-2222 TaxID=2935073 RepID=UPI0020BFCDB5|nr:hypothetical protein [Sporosarcina sp. NCCP-2222]
MFNWRWNRLSGVRMDILALESIIWRSDGYSGVGINYLAFGWIFWRWNQLSGVRMDILALESIIWRSN